MKKQELKQELLRTNAVIEILSIKFIQVSTQLEEVSEALERRRILYDLLANHSTIQKPKSMNEMADSLRKVSISVVSDAVWDEQIPFQELTQSQQDLWMDRLLTILN